MPGDASSFQERDQQQNPNTIQEAKYAQEYQIQRRPYSMGTEQSPKISNDRAGSAGWWQCHLVSRDSLYSKATGCMKSQFTFLATEIPDGRKVQTLLGHCRSRLTTTETF
tara:strand:+ start:69805 stop:70134 length:330 start_codon:yes stop_codon:yes gene_type:complete